MTQTADLMRHTPRHTVPESTEPVSRRPAARRREVAADVRAGQRVLDVACGVLRGEDGGLTAGAVLDAVTFGRPIER